MTLYSVIGSAPADEPLEVVGFAQEHGLRARVQLVHDEHGQLRLTPEQLAEYDEVKRVIGKRFRESGDYRMAPRADAERAVQVRRGQPLPLRRRIRPRSLVLADARALGRAARRVLARQAAHQFRTRKDCSASCTVGCVRNSAAPDAWRAQRLPDPGDRLVQIRSSRSPGS